MKLARCIICGAGTEYYFSKTYGGGVARFMEGIGEIHYRRCVGCGFVLSETHELMAEERWERLNREWHDYLWRNKTRIVPPPYKAQAAMLNALFLHGIINTANWLDYAAGLGTLSLCIEGAWGLLLPIHDAHRTGGQGWRYVLPADLGTYRTVINSAMFEHVRTREDLDKVNRLVSGAGCLVVHTLITDTVPQNASWHYLAPPVHCAFHTNRSMAVLMHQWGYDRSLYVHDGRCWVLFKAGHPDVADKIKAMQAASPGERIEYRRGFANY